METKQSPSLHTSTDHEYLSSGQSHSIPTTNMALTKLSPPTHPNDLELVNDNPASHIAVKCIRLPSKASTQSNKAQM